MIEDDETKKAFPLTQLLPAPVKRRVNALKKLQLESLKLEAQFFTEVYKLECHYQNLYKELYDKREKITSGSVEPTDEECKLDIPDLVEEEPDPGSAYVIQQLKEKLSLTKLIEEGSPGIPEFWLTIFKNVELLNDMIQPHDEPVLRYLTDVQVNISQEKMGFTLLFIFAPNHFFTNTCLTKEYEMKCSPEESDPWSFEGPEITKCKGCTIDWNQNMNVTLKTVKKRQRHKSRGAVRTIVKYVQNDSFFNFFNPPAVPDGEEVDEEIQAILTSDFEIGHYIRDKIIPHAVLYYTGEALEDDDFNDEDESSESDEFDGEEDDEEEEEDEDGDDDDSDAPSDNEATKTNNVVKKKNKNNKANKNNPQECAQQ